MSKSRRFRNCFQVIKQGFHAPFLEPLRVLPLPSKYCSSVTNTLVDLVCLHLSSTFIFRYHLGLFWSHFGTYRPHVLTYPGLGPRALAMENLGEDWLHQGHYSEAKKQPSRNYHGAVGWDVKQWLQWLAFGSQAIESHFWVTNKLVCFLKIKHSNFLPTLHSHPKELNGGRGWKINYEIPCPCSLMYSRPCAQRFR